MKLSVVIVNYNVKYFLAQCLLSVEKAIAEYAGKFGTGLIEVFVADNYSKDNSPAYIEENFPEVKLIKNEKNLGFSAANNQAIRQSSGEYVLLLNPDTIIPEDTFVKILEFADNNKDAGGVGVKMMDGKGVFLPESKRAFPSPAVSFYKIFGLSKLFPKSKRFGKYHLSYLDKDEINKVDVLSGAFMLLKKKALDEAGLLDETFFMYGEDIDLSYRIIKAGYSNYYFPEVNIVHYKGESTKKGSLKYVYMFYNAMIIFAKKHFKGKNAFLFSFLIKSAILFRAALSIIKRIAKTVFLPLVDIAIFYSGFFVIKPLWEAYKFDNVGHYPPEYMHYAVPGYILFWIFSIMLSKGYRTPIDSKRLFKGILFGTLVILVVYSLLNEEYRYSRMLLLAGTFWAMFFSWLVRAVFTVLNIKIFSFGKNKNSKVLFIPDNIEKAHSEKILRNYFEKNFDSFVKEDDEAIVNDEIKKKKITHLVVFSEKLMYKYFIRILSDVKNCDTETLAIYPDKGFMIGSGSVTVSGELLITENFNLNNKYTIFQKRAFDILMSLTFIFFSPLLILLTGNKKSFFGNIFRVLTGKNTWVGYIQKGNTEFLPKLRKGILNPVNYPVFDIEEIDKINFRYAGDYHLTDDFYTIYKSFTNIGNKNL